MKPERITLYLLTVILTLLSVRQGWCQSPAEIKKYKYPSKDSALYAKRAASRDFVNKIRPTERFDLVFNNGFLVTADMIDTIPIRSASSGSMYFGLGFNLIASPKWIIKFQAGICNYGFSFNNVPVHQKTQLFSFEGDTVTNKKLRMTYVDFPIGLAYVFKRDTAKGKLISMIEMGPTIGFSIGNRFTYNQVVNGKEATLEYNKLPHLNTIKYGMYAKISYGIVGLWVYYRLNSVFNSKEFIEGTKRSYPRFSAWEIGFSINL